MFHASCLCGDVTWETDGPFELMSHCHCSRCRKAHGTAFATYIAAPTKTLRVHGREQVVWWESSPGFHRCFCRRCGSVVPGDAAGEQIFMPAGNFIDDPKARPFAHIFVASKAPWYEIRDTLQQFQAYPENFEAPVVVDRPPLDPPGGIRGSCLCGGITFVVDAEPLRCWNCHCSRCRKARSAAYAANLFAAVDGVRFTRGEQHVQRYKVPEAERFTHVFCSTCGSTVPSLNRTTGIAMIPMGSLDDDPGIRPQAHIFVGSKATWFDIGDDLPQYAEYAT